MTHQVATRTTAKTEASSGSSRCMTEAIGIEQFSTSRRTSRRSIVDARDLHALVRAAEADAALNELRRHDAGVGPAEHRAQLVPEGLQRFPEIVRKLGASGLMALPTEADIAGPAAERHRGTTCSRRR